MQRLLSIISAAWLAVPSIWAGTESLPLRTLMDPATMQRSKSRQFVIHNAPDTSRVMVVPASYQNIVHLEPAMAVVTCERIKAALLHEFHEKDQWVNPIHIRLHHAMSLDETVVIKTDSLGRGWVYTVELPDKLDRSRLVMAVTEALLMEMAGRESRNTTEIPLWLGQGMSRQLMFASGTSQVGLIVDSPRQMSGGFATQPQSIDARQTDPLTEAHAVLRAQPPLSIAELSWPGQAGGEPGELYAANAQFFVHALLQLSDGPACLRAMLRELPAHLNWQIAFYQAFHKHFSSALELEKWWALQLVEFTGRDLSQMWPYAESWTKLDEVLRPSVEVRTRTDQMPLHAQASLQAIVQDWDQLRQMQLLDEKMRQLFILRMRVAPELLGLVDDYRGVLEDYVTRRNHAHITLLGMTLYTRNTDSMARDAIQKLNELDARREKLHAKPNNPIASNQLPPKNP